MSITVQLRKLINLIDRLRDANLDSLISLPKICVLGTQSSGKSSLLESIVGIDFLPKGEGVVTRVPLELRLVRNPEIKTPTAEFEKLKNQKFTDFNIVKEKINELTDSIAGKKKGIVNQPIKLTISSSYSPDLTLIDLPGITRIPLAGSDQPKDIEKITKGLCEEYCSDKTTIILCVIPANADISTSEALKMAMELDPQNERTIGVLTKVDIMDQGTNAKDILLGNLIKLKLGFIAVKNRSQLDLNSKIKVQEAIEKEKNYFATHTVYSSMSSNHFGIEVLTKKLSEILNNHIRTCLPSINNQINLKIEEITKNLNDLGIEIPFNVDDKRIFFLEIIRNFTATYNNLITGCYDINEKRESNKLSPGHKINELFDLLFTDIKTIAKEISNDDINKAISIHEGETLPGFHSIDAFLYLLQPRLEKFRKPTVECVEEIVSILNDIGALALQAHARKFPIIQEKLFQLISDYLKKEQDKCKKMVKTIIDSETGYLFTNDLELVKKELEQSKTKKDEKKTYESTYNIELRERISVYFDLVYRNLKDLIPKMIGYYLVKNSQENIQTLLLNEIINNEFLLNSLSEPDNIIKDRKKWNDQLKIFRNAKSILKQTAELSLDFEDKILEMTNE